MLGRGKQGSGFGASRFALPTSLWKAWGFAQWLPTSLYELRRDKSTPQAGFWGSKTRFIGLVDLIYGELIFQLDKYPFSVYIFKKCIHLIVRAYGQNCN